MNNYGKKQSKNKQLKEKKEKTNQQNHYAGGQLKQNDNVINMSNGSGDITNLRNSVTGQCTNGRTRIIRNNTNCSATQKDVVVHNLALNGNINPDVNIADVHNVSNVFPINKKTVNPDSLHLRNVLSRKYFLKHISAETVDPENTFSYMVNIQGGNTHAVYNKLSWTYVNMAFDILNINFNDITGIEISETLLARRATLRPTILRALDDSSNSIIKTNFCITMKLLLDEAALHNMKCSVHNVKLTLCKYIMNLNNNSEIILYLPIIHGNVCNQCDMCCAIVTIRLLHSIIGDMSETINHDYYEKVKNLIYNCHSTQIQMSDVEFDHLILHSLMLSINTMFGMLISNMVAQLNSKEIAINFELKHGVRTVPTDVGTDYMGITRAVTALTAAAMPDIFELKAINYSSKRNHNIDSGTKKLVLRLKKERKHILYEARIDGSSNVAHGALELHALSSVFFNELVTIGVIDLSLWKINIKEPNCVELNRKEMIPCSVLYDPIRMELNNITAFTSHPVVNQCNGGYVKIDINIMDKDHNVLFDEYVALIHLAIARFIACGTKYSEMESSNGSGDRRITFLYRNDQCDNRKLLSNINNISNPTILSTMEGLKSTIRRLKREGYLNNNLAASVIVVWSIDANIEHRRNFNIQEI